MAPRRFCQSCRARWSPSRATAEQLPHVMWAVGEELPADPPGVRIAASVVDLLFGREIDATAARNCPRCRREANGWFRLACELVREVHRRSEQPVARAGMARRKSMNLVPTQARRFPRPTAPSPSGELCRLRGCPDHSALRFVALDEYWNLRAGG